MIDGEYGIFARQLIAESGPLIASYFLKRDLPVEEKADQSIVTVADRRAEALLRERILKRYPHHGIIGEEYGTENPDAEFVWVLDPIDGTISFAGGCPLFGTLIGLLCEGTPVLGVIHQPILQQLMIGDGQRCLLNDEPVHVRDGKTLNQATLLATDYTKIEQYHDGKRFDELRRSVGVFRMWGDCYGYLLLASGWADVMVDPLMHPWDILPLIPIVRGAGGIITSWNGGDPVIATSCIAATPTLHEQVIRYLNLTQLDGA